jgi:uncharacterized protein (TIGR00730 family)
MRICVFCGSSSGRRPAYAAAARDLGGLLARRGIGLVYGGGKVGLMGALADAALAAGGEVIGVIPRFLLDKEVDTMHERKALMASLADAFVALPGGLGTWEEFCEILTWGQLGLHHKPCMLVNVDGFYTPLLAQLDHATAEGLLRPEDRARVSVADSAEAVVDAVRPADPATR